MSAPPAAAQRVIFHCVDGRLFVVDERGNSERVRELIDDELGDEPDSVFLLEDLLAHSDIGDATYRVRAATSRGFGFEWVYELRYDATGETAAQIGKPGSQFRRVLEALPRRGFAYFVVHDDSFEVFREAREIARNRGVATGWHPVEGKPPLRFSANGSLGKRIQ